MTLTREGHRLLALYEQLQWEVGAHALIRFDERVAASDNPDRVGKGSGKVQSPRLRLGNSLAQASPAGCRLEW